MRQGRIWALNPSEAVELLRRDYSAFWPGREEDLSSQTTSLQPVEIRVSRNLKYWFDIIRTAAGQLIVTAAARQLLAPPGSRICVRPARLLLTEERSKNESVIELVEHDPLYFLFNFPRISFDLQKSSYEEGKLHPECGQLSPKWKGLEFRYGDTVILPGSDILYSRQFRQPREVGMGIYIKQGSLPKEMIFNIPGADFTLCCDKTREKVLDHGLTGIEFLEYGSIFN